MSDLAAVPVAVDIDWSDTGYWSRLTPNPGNSLAFIVWNCCVGGELVQHNAAPARGGLVVSSRCTRAHNRVLHASLVESGGCTVGAEFCAERQTIAAKWLNCSQLNKCFQPYLPVRERRSRRARLLSYAPLFFPAFSLRGNSLSYTVLVPHVSSLVGRERTSRSGVTEAQVKRRLLRSSFLIPLVMRSRVRSECVRVNRGAVRARCVNEM